MTELAATYTRLLDRVICDGVTAARLSYASKTLDWPSSRQDTQTLALIALVKACESRRLALDARREFGSRSYQENPYSILSAEFKEHAAGLDDLIHTAERNLDIALVAIHAVVAPSIDEQPLPRVELALNDQPCQLDGRSHVVDGPDDTDQPCPHGDYRSCVVDGCRPLRRVHVAGVIVPPAARVACMWCGEDSDRGQCGPCATLLDAIHAAPRAGVAAIIDATRSKWKTQPREP